MIREAAVFQGGLLLALLAVVSPLGYWSGIYIWVRALQDLTLAFVAPGLIVLGAPWSALARCLGRPAPGASDATGPRPWWLRWPVATVVAFNVIWLGGHLTVAFDRVPVSRAAARRRVRAVPRRGDPVLAAADRLAAVEPGRSRRCAGRRCWPAPWRRTPCSAWC